MPKRETLRSRVIAEISAYPIGEGTSLGEFVRRAYRSMATVSGVRLVPGAMSTVIEAPDLDHVLAVVRKAHAALQKAGARRISISLRIDHRLDKSETIEYKLGRISGEIP